MIRWCSYCQKFLGEVRPYDNLAMTHGVCADCKPISNDPTRTDYPQSEAMRMLLGRVMRAGRSGDFQAIDLILDEAANANVRLVDILLGIITPALVDIGNEWQRGTITNSDQQRFNEFCEAIFEMISARIQLLHPAMSNPHGKVDALLMNAPGNRHTLAIRILALWLLDKGSIARVLDASVTVLQLSELIRGTTPRYLLISVALANQIEATAAIVERLAELPGSIRPKIYIGGNAIKMGLVSPIPGAELLADINAL